MSYNICGCIIIAYTYMSYVCHVQVNLLFAPPGADLGRLEKKFEPIMFQLPFKNKNSYALVVTWTPRASKRAVESQI